MKAPASLGALAGALLAVTSAHASTVSISGVRFGEDGTVSFVGYSNLVQSQNNVVNSSTSLLSDATNGAYWYVEGNSTPSQATTSLSSYNVDWYFVGAESGYLITFTDGGSVSHNENNQNNDCCYGSPYWNSLNSIGTSAGLTSSVIPIEFLINGGPGVSNGANNPAFDTQTLASIMFGYVEPDYVAGALVGWVLVDYATDWFAFGIDDGGVDDNHDDWMGIARVYAVPLPVTLPLFATGLFALGFAGRWRRRPRRLGA